MKKPFYKLNSTNKLRATRLSQGFYRLGAILILTLAAAVTLLATAPNTTIAMAATAVVTNPGTASNTHSLSNSHTLSNSHQLRNSAESILSDVARIHGDAGPFATVGYRIGQRALKELGLKQGSYDLEVIHHTPFEVQYGCMADGVQASTGVSAGKFNLTLMKDTVANLHTVFRNRKTGKVVSFRLKESFLKAFLNLDPNEHEKQSRQVLSLTDHDIFNLEPKESFQ